MAHVRRVYVDFARVRLRGEEAELMVRIAVAVNNMMSGDYLFGLIDETRAAAKTANFGRRIAQYLISVQVGHLNEGLLLVENPNDAGLTVKKADGLKRFLDGMSPEGKQRYAVVSRVLDVPSERNRLETYVRQFRNRVSFHVDVGHRGRGQRGRPVTAAALERLAARRQVGAWDLMDHRPGERDIRRFEFADLILDAAVCRDVWGIAITKSSRAVQDEADAILTWIFDLARAYVGFASELCALYFKEFVI